MQEDKKIANSEKSALMMRLRALLLEEDRKRLDGLNRKISALAEDINTKEKLAAKVDPIVQDRLDALKQDFPVLFGPVITDTIKYQIKNSQNEVVDALYPIMGKLIRKYIAREIELISERVDKQLEKAFSWKGWLRRIKGWFTGTRDTDIVLQGLAEPTIEEIFVIEQESGLLYGSYSRTKNMDQDMIAGMLTAIKSFVADAFKNGEQELEAIEYESYHIVFKNFKTYYLAIAISGTLTAAFKDKLETTVLNFANHLRKQAQKVSDKGEDLFTGTLESYFNKFEDGIK